MTAQDAIQTIVLPARTVHRIEAGKGLEVTCVAGVAWITQANDRRDVLLASGQSFVLDQPGLALVMALNDMTVTIGPPGARHVLPHGDHAVAEQRLAA